MSCPSICIPLWAETCFMLTKVWNGTVPAFLGNVWTILGVINEKGLNWVTVCLFVPLKRDWQWSLYYSIVSANAAKLTEETVFPKIMVSFKVPPWSSTLSVTDLNRPQTLASAVLFRNHDGLTFTAFRKQRAWWSAGAGWEENHSRHF